MTEENDKIELKPTEGYAWYEFIMATIKLDTDNHRVLGWHWFWGLYHLRNVLPNFPKFDFETIQDKISDEHWLKKEHSVPHYSDDFKLLVDTINQACSDPKIVTSIVFMNRDFTSPINFESFIFPVKIQIPNSVFSDIVNFSNAVFLENVDFSNTKFLKHSDFSNAVFLKNVDFSNTKFLKHADFIKADFAKNANYYKASFAEKVNFNQAVFSNGAHFHEATFSDISDFSNAVFLEHTNFSNTKFLKHANFSNTNFTENANYYKASFAEKVNFNQAVFSNGAHFHEATFSGDVAFNNANFHKGNLLTSFNKAIFLQPAHFNSAEFHNQVNFLDAKFHRNAIFDNAIFSQSSNFKKTTFFQRSMFKKTTFMQNATFMHTTFSNVVNFTSTSFSNSVNFTNSEFLNSAIFENASFGDKTFFDLTKIKKTMDFTNAHFKVYVPSFYNAEIYPDIFWDKAKWPSSAQFKSTKDFKKIQYNKNAYENLANHMEAMDKYHDQHFFFRLEMRCRKRLGGFFSFLMHGLYEWFANYGYGVGRAFSWWVGHMCFWATILYFFNFKDISSTYERLACSVLTSVSNAHSFFLSKNERLQSCYKIEDATPTFNLIWAFETIFGALFLFLILLTLRIRFKLK